MELSSPVCFMSESQILSPPAPRPASEAPDGESKPERASSELRQSLDTLLEQYLHLLDRQQQLQSGLGKQLSSGFFALAHANYTCPPGRRYGADYYDERMKATRKISIHERQEEDGTESDTRVEVAASSGPEFKYNFCLESLDHRQPDDEVDTKKDTQNLSSEPSTEESSREDATHATDDSETPSSADKCEDESTSKAVKTTPKKFRSNDPIHWYGILVSPSLRTAQKSFTGAIQSQVPDLAGTIVEMRALEERIDRIRTELESQSAKDSSS